MHSLSLAVVVSILAFFSKTAISDGGLQLYPDNVNMNCLAMCQPIVQLTTLCEPADTGNQDDQQGDQEDNNGITTPTNGTTNAAGVIAKQGAQKASNGTGAGTGAGADTGGDQGDCQNCKRFTPVYIRQDNQSGFDGEQTGENNNKRRGFLSSLFRRQNNQSGFDGEQTGDNNNKRSLPVSIRQDNQSGFDGEQTGDNNNKRRSLPVSIRQNNQTGFDGEQTGENNNKRRALPVSVRQANNQTGFDGEQTGENENKRAVPIVPRDGKKAKQAKQNAAVSANTTQCVCANTSFNVALVAGLCGSCLQQNGNHTKQIMKILNNCNITSTSTYTPAATSVLAGINVVANGVAAVSTTPAAAAGSSSGTTVAGAIGSSSAAASLLDKTLIWTIISSTMVGFAALIVL